MNNQINSLVQMLLSRNPNVQNNPQSKALLDVIMNNDAERGQQIAENLCKTYGVTKDDAVAQAKKFFNI